MAIEGRIANFDNRFFGLLRDLKGFREFNDPYGFKAYAKDYGPDPNKFIIIRKAWMHIDLYNTEGIEEVQNDLEKLYKLGFVAKTV